MIELITFILGAICGVISVVLGLAVFLIKEMSSEEQERR